MAILAGGPVSSLPISSVPSTGTPAAGEDHLLGINDGSADVVAWSGEDSAYHNVYEGSKAEPLSDDVVLAEPIYSNSDTPQDGSEIDWSDWSWAQAPPIADNNPDLAPSALDEQDFTDHDGYGFVQNAGEEQDHHLGTTGLDEQDFTDLADYGFEVGPLSADAQVVEDFLFATDDGNTRDDADYEDYGFAQNAGEEQDAQLGDGAGLDNQDYTDYDYYGFEGDQVGADAQVVEDFLFGTEDGNTRDDTDYEDYGSQSSAGIEQDHLLGDGAGLDDQDWTDTEDYGGSVNPLADDLPENFALGDGKGLDAQDFTDTEEYGWRIEPLTDDLPTLDCLYPVVTSVTSGADSAAGTSHTVALPTVSAGDRLLIIFENRETNISWPAGFTELYDDGTGGAASSAAYRDCDGTEGASIVVTTGTSRVCSWHVFLIEDGTFNPAQAPEVGTVATGNSTDPDPPALGTSWGSDYALWLVATAGDTASAQSISAYPATYSDNQTFVQGSSGGANGYLAVATKNAQIGADDPGTFTLGTTDQWAAQTLVVRGVCGLIPLYSQPVDNSDLGFDENSYDGFSVDPLGADAVITDPPQAQEPEQDYTDHTDYGFSEDAGFEQDPLLSSNEPEQDYTDFDDYGSQSRAGEEQDQLLGNGQGLDDQDLTDLGEYGFTQEPVGADFTPAVEDFLLGISEDEADRTDFTDYGFTSEPLSENAPDALLGQHEPEQDYTDLTDYGFDQGPVGPDLDEPLLGQHEPEQDYTDHEDYAFVGEPNSNNSADVNVFVTGGNIIAAIGCFHVIAWIEVPDVVAVWTEIAETADTWTPIAEPTTTWSDVAEPSTDWTEVPDVSTTWEEEC